MSLENFEIYKVILAPLSTEKTNIMSEKYKRLSFKVACWANKVQIKNAVEKLFAVKVDQVATMNVLGKVKSFKQRKTRHSNWKKAVVKLKDGQDINIAEYINS